MSRKATDAEGYLTREVRVENRYGMHARPAAMIVETAKRFDSEIEIDAKGNAVSAKSIMGLLTLAAAHGAVLTLRAKGPDAAEALDALQSMFASKFEEE